jgi:signal transduction histidine kinase
MNQADDAPSQEALAEARRSVRSLRLALAMCALLLALFTLVAGLLSWNAVYAREQRYMLSLAEVTERSLDAYFQSLETALAGLRREVADPAGQIDFALLAPVMKRFKETYPDLRRLLVIRLDGQVLASSDEGQGSGASTLAGQPSFVRARREILGGQHLSVGQPLRGPNSGEWIIPVRYGARDAAGNVMFFIAVALPIAKVQSFWKDVPLPDRAAMSLIHAEGFVLSRFPVPASMPLEEVFRRPVSDHVQAYHRAHAADPSGWFEEMSRVTHANSMVAYQRLIHYPLTVQVVNPKLNAWREWWRDTQLVFVLILALMLAGSVVYRWAMHRQLEWEAERAQRLIELTRANREMEDFTYTVSHDLRAPLRAVDGYAAILGEELGSDLPEDQVHALQKIRDSAQRMGLLIDGLLAFAQRSRQALDKRDIDVYRMVRAVLADVLPRGSRIAVTVGTLPPCRADGSALRQVWVNLISNALKFGAGATHPRLTIGYEQGAYFVRDNGAGFDMAHAKSLFSVFSHTNSAGEYDGSGVGLATVQRIIERHGGRVWAESAPGHGATFYFILEGKAEGARGADEPGGA